MAIARLPAIVTMPECPSPRPSIVDFLANRFPQVDRLVWVKRIQDGKVLDNEKKPISLTTPYVALQRLYYFREVEEERVIPFAEEILFQDENLLVADKPHFLPTAEGGRFVEQSLLYRLREFTGNERIAPLHRLDRDTAGLVMFSLNPETASLYHMLFQNREIWKVYHAISPCVQDTATLEWLVENRIERANPPFRSKVVAGDINARSRIELLDTKKKRSFFKLFPSTGKKHQLRLHMASLGFPIENDRYYPRLQNESPDDFEKPLQLLAKELRFIDPLNGVERRFESNRNLNW